MTSPKPIIILGTGGNCVDVLDTIADINDSAPSQRYTCIGFLDDDPQKWGCLVHGVEVLGPLSAAPDYPEADLVNGIGSPHSFLTKPEIIAQTGASLDRFATIVHPTASVSRLSTIGGGTVVFQNVTITSNVQIGHQVIILPNTVVSHDDVIEDYTCIAGGVCISGGVHVGRNCYLGTRSAIIGNVSIGDRSLVGMGSVVLDSVPSDVVYVGNPARFLKHSDDLKQEASYEHTAS